MNYVALLIGVCMFCLSGGEAEGAISATDLRCEYQREPLAIDSVQPMLSWQLQSAGRAQSQSGWQILAASSLEKLQMDQGDLCNSGKVESDQSVGILYRGRAVDFGTTCFWKVRVWDHASAASPWSEPASWETGLASEQAWQAVWIDDGKTNPEKDADFFQDDPAPLFRREFVLPGDVVRARLYISGLGYYQASLNGDRVGDHLLDPGWTRYSQRVLYSAYDVTPQLHRGANCIGVTLGNGW